MFDRRGGRKYLNSAERRRLLAVIEAETDAPTRAFALTLFYTGCRISEALKLTVERTDLAEKALVFETLKRRSDGYFRAVPIPDTLCRLFRILLQGREAQARVWCLPRRTAYRRIKRLMRRAGVAGSMACPKGMRHAMGVAYVGKKVPLTIIQKWMGHARVETTALYLDVSGEEERQLARRAWKDL